MEPANQILVILNPRDAARLRPHVLECILDTKIDAQVSKYRVTPLPNSPLLSEYSREVTSEDVVTSNADFTDTNTFLTMVNALPPSLIIIWNAIHSIDDNNRVILNQNYMFSAGLELEDIINLFIDIGLTPFDEDSEFLEFSIGKGKNPVPLILKSKVADPSNMIDIDETILKPIFNSFEPMPSSTSENAELVKRQLFQFYVNAFNGLKITRLGLKMLNREMKNRFAEAVAPGQMPIGNICSDALAAQMMQTALDAKHAAGIGKSVGASSNLLREILRAIKNIRNLEMEAYFKNRRITPDEIDIYRKAYEYISLQELSTEKPSEVEGSFNDLVPEVPEGWAEKYAALEGFTIPESEFKLQITIDVQKAYNRGVTIDRIVRSLKEAIISELKPSRPLVRFIVTPRYVRDEKAIKEGVTNRRVWIETKIFIIPDPVAAKNEILNNEKLERYQDFILVKKEGKLRQFTLSILLIEVILPLLSTVYVSGIPGIERVKTNYRVLTTYIINEYTRRVYYNEEATKESNPSDSGKRIYKYYKLKAEDELWRIGLNDRLIRLHFLELSDFENLFTTLKFRTFRPENPDEKNHIYVIPPANWAESINLINETIPDPKNKIKNPFQYVIYIWNNENKRISEQEKFQKEQEIKKAEEYRKLREEAENTGKPLPRNTLAPPPKEILTPLILANRVYYIRTEGSNLLAFIRRPEIDQNKLLTNNVHEMLIYYGVGVARALIMYRISSVLGDDDKYIDPGYVMLIADVITNRGKVFGIDFTGIKQHQSNILSLMSAERPTALLITWASFSVEEKISGVSAQIMVGQPPTGGSGGVDIVKSEQLLSDLANEIQPFSMDDIAKELRGLDEIYGPNIYARRDPVNPQPKKVIVREGPISNDPAPLPPTVTQIPSISPVLRNTATQVMATANIEDEYENYD